MKESPDLISSFDGYAVTILSISSAILFSIGFCWIYGYERLIIDFIFWFNPTYPVVTKVVVIVFSAIVVPISLLVSRLFQSKLSHSPLKSRVQIRL